MIVIKYGGSLLDEPGHRTEFLKDIAELSKKVKVILVHGGGKEISRQMEAAGLMPKFVNGRRFTDEATMSVVEKALSGLNQEIVAELNSLGAKAEGGSGQTDHILQASAIGELGRVGMPMSVNSEALHKITSGDSLRVFYSVAEDSSQKPLNINADDFAQAIAVAVRATRLIFLTDSGGVFDGGKKLIPVIHPNDVEPLETNGVITGGMLVKAKACRTALEAGVGSVDIVKGVKYLLSPDMMQPEGTVFTNGH